MCCQKPRGTHGRRNKREGESEWGLEEFVCESCSSCFSRYERDKSSDRVWDTRAKGNEDR